MKKVVLLIILLMLLVLGIYSSYAQTAVPIVGQTVAAPTQEGSVQIFFVACETSAVLNLSGEMLAGWDVFYQVFSGPDGTGTAITSLRQVPVDGVFAVSDQPGYNSGATVPAGSVASVRVTIARETNSNTIDADFTVSDAQDGCSNPQNALVSSTDLGSTDATPSAAANAIRSPFGGFLNEPRTVTPEPVVVIGPRIPANAGRSQTAGVIFAECDQNSPEADPGVIYDSDNVVVFWSWWARTEEQMQAHIDNAQYAVTMNGAPFPVVTRTEPERLTANLWTFYYANVGNLRPGHYTVNFQLTWANAVSDGFDDYGPGTANPIFNSSCNFDVRPNPDGASVQFQNLFYPG